MFFSVRRSWANKITIREPWSLPWQMQTVGTHFDEKNILEKPKVRLEVLLTIYFWYETNYFDTILVGNTLKWVFCING